VRRAPPWVLSLALLAASPVPRAEEVLSLEQALARVVESYPSLAVAGAQLARARQENARIESLLGWNLAAQGGYAREVSIIGSPTDRVSLGADLDRRLRSGSTLGLSGSAAREDSELTFAPTIPNPQTTTEFGINYRQPWARGDDFPDYAQGLKTAGATLAIAEADRRGEFEQVARQVAELYYSASATQARLRSAERAIGRAERLLDYVRRNARLGVSETKDLLQAEAQLRARQAERDGLVTAWEQQRVNLNRLMGRPWSEPFRPQAPETVPAADADPAAWQGEAERHSPAIQRNRARLDLAEAAIARARDARKDKLDVVYSLGSRARRGDAAVGSVSDSELVGGVRLEYGRALDRRGVDAGLVQAQIDRDIALENIRLVQDDLHYAVYGLARQIEANRNAVESARRSLDVEQRKLAEATERYRRGRTETDRLIQYEAELYLAELSWEQQLIELARRHTELAVVRGALWTRIGAAMDGPRGDGGAGGAQ